MMNITNALFAITFAVLFLVFSSCKDIVTKTKVNEKEEHEVADKNSKTDTIIFQTHYFDTTLHINNQIFNCITKDINEDEMVFLCYIDKAIVFSDTFSSYVHDIDYIDFDDDGFMDVLFGNFDSFYSLYVFDSTKNTFTFVEGFDRFAEPIKLNAHSNYYYSYRRAGCQDLNWISDLFLIVNSKTYHVGHIYGQSCEDDDKPEKIEIFRVLNNDDTKKVLFKTFPLDAYISHIAEKWDFNEYYWKNNYKKFN
jgi:hypothetical protein